PAPPASRRETGGLSPLVIACQSFGCGVFVLLLILLKIKKKRRGTEHDDGVSLVDRNPGDLLWHSGQAACLRRLLAVDDGLVRGLGLRQSPGPPPAAGAIGGGHGSVPGKS